MSVIDELKALGFRNGIANFFDLTIKISEYNFIIIGVYMDRESLELYHASIVHRVMIDKDGILIKMDHIKTIQQLKKLIEGLRGE